MPVETAASAEHGHILVVDDYPMNRLKLARLLQQDGHRVTQAENGEQALALVRSEPFDVVLLDLMMPGIDGMQVLETMKRDLTLRDIPIIIISAVDEIDSVVRCIEMGAEDYLQKDFNPVFLRARLGASLQKKRLREMEKAYLQQEVALRQSEKLATLGKLSAGIAHELNNPAAAVRRGAAQLDNSLGHLQQAHVRLRELNLSAQQMKSLEVFDKLAQSRAQKAIFLDALARSDREAEWEAWLEDQGIENAWEIAPTLVNLGFAQDELADLAATLNPAQLSAVLTWLDSDASIYTLVGEIGMGAGRISEIVKALKAYTYLDQAPVQNVNLQDGLENTLIILRSKLRDGIIVRRDYAPDMPTIEAYGSELNQVWTNLIDNAIDAVHGRGELTLRTRHDGQWAIVEIEDNGPGIPEEVQAHIFDPFFTTKPPGSGTGMGLNITHHIIVNQHKGRIAVYSQPGKTRFEIQLPLQLARREPAGDMQPVKVENG
jgi:signal transduction histidine kinase